MNRSILSFSISCVLFLKEESIEFLFYTTVLTSQAYSQARLSRKRPATLPQQLFTREEFEWFSKNIYTLSFKYCANMPPVSLVRLLQVCVEVRTYLNLHIPC